MKRFQPLNKNKLIFAIVATLPLVTAAQKQTTPLLAYVCDIFTYLRMLAFACSRKTAKWTTCEAECGQYEG